MRDCISITLLLCAILCHTNLLVSTEPILGYKVRRAESNEFPFLVSIANKKLKIKGREEEAHFCGGSLVTRKHVLTAEHCVKGEVINDLEVTVGSNDLRKGDQFSVKSVITFVEWAKNYCVGLKSEDHDLAIITLTRCVSESIELPKLTAAEDNLNFYDTNAVVAGWGNVDTKSKPRFLRTAIVNIINRTDCIQEIQNALNDGKVHHVSRVYLCTKNNPYTMLGNGDSGGPLIINKNEIIGVNESVCPSRNKFPNICSNSRVNMHIGIAYYNLFINGYISGELVGHCDT